MAESAQEVRVFVSSPRDVLPERGRVDAVATKLNREYEGLAQIKTVLWEESFYKANRTFQSQFRRQRPAILCCPSFGHNRHGVTAGICTHARRAAVPLGHRV